MPWRDRDAAAAVVIDDAENLLVLHPDTLVSGTAVADSFVCLRKSVIQGRNPRGVGQAGVCSAAALKGSLIHELFQAVVEVAARDGLGGARDGDEFGPLGSFALLCAVEDVIARFTADLYSADMTPAAAREMMLTALPGVVEWCVGFMDQGCQVRERKTMRAMRVDGVDDVEESIWSPVFGVKGKVDVTVRLRDVGLPEGDAVVAPVELKTGSSRGNASTSHHAQVVLYTLLMSHRYERPVHCGLLTYIRPAREEGKRGGAAEEDGTCLAVAMRDEVIGLIVQRNKLAGFLAHDADVDDLPPMLVQSKLCQHCFAVDSCMVQHHLLEGGDAASAESIGPGVSLFKEKAGHLAVEHRQYYRFWKKAMMAEESLAVSKRVELWAMSSADREKQGRCWGELQLVRENCAVGKTTPGFSGKSRQRTCFKRMQHGNSDGKNVSFTSSKISAGDYVALSVVRWNSKASADAEPVVVNLATGFVGDVGDDLVVILADRDIFNWCSVRSLDDKELVWRIDAEEILASYSTAKATIESLFVSDDGGGQSKLRTLVAELQPPNFLPMGANEIQLLSTLASDLKEKGMCLNGEQRCALQRSREAQDYMLLLGMPGTGKTATLVTIVLAAVQFGETVLICSHTRTAVDNVLSRLLDVGFTDFVRVGALGNGGDSRLNTHHVTTGGDVSYEELVSRLETPSVVATTCLGVSHPVFAKRTEFDRVVIDEASQILQPICVGPLRFARKSFVLVGDHFQLPPLLRSNKKQEQESCVSEERGAVEIPPPIEGSGDEPEQSLFRRLCEAHPSAVTSLVQQYRMAADIMDISNALVYCGKLCCGTPEVASQMLKLPTTFSPGASLWIEMSLNPACRVLFLDTDGISTQLESSPSDDDVKASVRKNSIEGSIILSAITALCRKGLSSNDIAVLSPFRAQVGFLRETVGNIFSPAVDISTIDQYQGKDKDCVFISFVRSNTSNSVGQLLLDWRRINVGLTRAKSKLILVGSSSTIAGGSCFLGSMMEMIRARGSVVAVTKLETS